MSGLSLASPAGFTLAPEQASAAAGQVDQLFLALLLACGGLTLAVVVLVTWFGFRYRAGRSVRRGDPPSERVAHRVEAMAAMALLVLFMGLFFWAGRLYLDMYRGPADVTTIDVVAKQWMWKVYHRNGAREINAMHVPVGETIRLRIVSEDVVHSFYVPAFRLKRDALPGQRTYAWFKATRTGEYRLFCAEYCGTDHARMTGRVVVMPRAEFQHWLENRGAAGGAFLEQGSEPADGDRKGEEP